MRISLALAAATLWMAGCSEKADVAPSPSHEPAPSAESGHLPDPAASGVPSEDEAAAAAATSIHADNADEEMDKLESEIGGGQ